MRLMPEAETVAWLPFAQAMQAAYDAWRAHDGAAGGDEFIVAMDQAMEAWAVYREQRYGRDA